MATFKTVVNKDRKVEYIMLTAQEVDLMPPIYYLEVTQEQPPIIRIWRGTYEYPDDTIKPIAGAATIDIAIVDIDENIQIATIALDSKGEGEITFTPDSPSGTYRIQVYNAPEPEWKTKEVTMTI